MRENQKKEINFFTLVRKVEKIVGLKSKFWTNDDQKIFDRLAEKYKLNYETGYEKYKKQEEKMKSYQVTVFAQNSWTRDSDGVCRKIVERDCGHVHRTLTGVCRCYRHLTRQLSDGMYAADFYHAEITCNGAERLSDDDAAAVDEINEDYFRGAGGR